MNNISISGSIGYVLLKQKEKHVLIMSDIHSNQPYCNSGIMIDEYLNYSNTDYNNIILEEVSRKGVKLEPLWSDAPHTIKLKKLFIRNNYKEKNKKKIIPIDIRPYLVPFSWELLSKENVKDEKKNITLEKFLTKIDLFFNIFDNKKNMRPIKSFLDQILFYIELRFEKENKTGIYEHYIALREYYFDFIKKLKINNLMNSKLINIFNNNTKILHQISQILSFIIEWFTILQIFSNKKNSIIHSGLAHTSNIVETLKKHYNFKEIESNGIITFNPENLKDNQQSCIKLSRKVLDIFNR